MAIIETITQEVKEISKDVRKSYGVSALLFLVAIIAFGWYLFDENKELKAKCEKSDNRLDSFNVKITVLQMELLRCNEELKYCSDTIIIHQPIKKKHR